jgi:hypothetical protein
MCSPPYYFDEILLKVALSPITPNPIILRDIVSFGHSRFLLKN